MQAQYQYLDLVQRILTEGKWVTNERTGKRCLTVINENFKYVPGETGLITSRKSHWKQAVAEMNGYLRGYSSAADFRAIGANTWDANANSAAWQKNPHCTGEDDMGRVYGVQGRKWAKPDGGFVDQYANIVNDLMRGYDNRGEILSFYNPGEFHMGCLRPCMHTHQFSVLDNKLYLNSYQRSIDVPLGLVFNMIQVNYLLQVTAQITGLEVGGAFHNLVNCHIYEDQIPAMKELLSREPMSLDAKLQISPKIGSLRSLEQSDLSDAFDLYGYDEGNYHPHIEIPFSV